jgi:hypothetical protein
MVKNDLEALGRMLPDDFTYTHASGVADTKATLLASLKAGRLKYKSIDPGSRSSASTAARGSSPASRPCRSIPPPSGPRRSRSSTRTCT